MRISAYVTNEIRRRIKDRHYYLRMARISIKLKNEGDMHMFCSLAEREQRHIDEFARWHPTYKLA